MMNKTDMALSELLKASLFGLPANIAEDVDWQEVFKEAHEQGDADLF